MEALVIALNKMPLFVVSGLMFLVAYGSLIVFASIAGRAGIYCFIILAIVGANIQVLKLSQFPFFTNPIALGTELFAATYLATDMLSEFYGTRAAKLGVLLGFLGMLLWVIIGLLSLGFRPVSAAQVNNDAWALGMQANLSTIFLPLPIFLVASLSAYLISQFNDVFIYEFIKRKTANRFLWLRNNISTMISALVDNTIFSIMAWIILAEEPMPFKKVLFTYILGTYVFRIVGALLDTPAIYFMQFIFKAKRGLNKLK